MEDAAARLARDPRYIALVRRRGRFTTVLTAIMLIVYFGFVLTIAFDKALLAQSVSGGATSWGIPVGLGVIALAILLTGLYVWRANRDFDPVIEALRTEYGA
ncbi:DUF485 domain-containing protein [Sphingomonas fuzhouensis]|uniref:DUF485 domain-containing protein n=1 Tax=Sphingomonas fuzhouensis TaxID=3106033 RepID=UPI002AFDE403|nr:DUF485 domain-containing protein [Sphingomonas sp. SGZ-02]